MSSRRAAAVFAIALALTVGPSVAVVAQSDGDGATVRSWVTGTLSDPTDVVQGTVADADGVTQRRDWMFTGSTLESDDPRLAGTVSITVNADERVLPDEAGIIDLASSTYRIESDEGGWSGHGTAVVHIVGEEIATNLDTVVLSGHGAHDGLSAYLVIDFTRSPATIEGAVVEGTLPPVPDDGA